MYLYRFIFEMLCGTVIFAALSFALFTASGSHIAKLEKLTRDPRLGLIIALPALAACIPHAQIVAPGILQNPAVLWGLAIAIVLLSYFYIDYYAARALAGAVIILAYDLIHYSYEWLLPGMEFMVIMAWLSGFAGIWASGKPHALRDCFRLAASQRRFAICSALTALVWSLTYLWALINGALKIR